MGLFSVVVSLPCCRAHALIRTEGESRALLLLFRSGSGLRALTACGPFSLGIDESSCSHSCAPWYSAPPCRRPARRSVTRGGSSVRPTMRDAREMRLQRTCACSTHWQQGLSLSATHVYATPVASPSKVQDMRPERLRHLKPFVAQSWDDARELDALDVVLSWQVPEDVHFIDRLDKRVLPHRASKGKGVKRQGDQRQRTASRTPHHGHCICPWSRRAREPHLWVGVRDLDVIDLINVVELPNVEILLSTRELHAKRSR